MAPAIEARGVIQRRVLVNGTAVTLQVVPGESAANLDFVVKDLTHLLTWDFEPNQRHLLNLPSSSLASIRRGPRPTTT